MGFSLSKCNILFEEEDVGMVRRSKGYVPSGGYWNCDLHSIDGATSVENLLWHGMAQHIWLATSSSTSPQLTVMLDQGECWLPHRGI